MFPKGFQKKTIENLFFQQEEPQQVFLTLDSVSGVRLSSQLVPGKRESAGRGLHCGLMGDACGPALKSNPSRPPEPLPVILFS